MPSDGQRSTLKDMERDHWREHHLYYDDLEPASKASLVNHRQQRTAFETDTGRSASAAGTALHTPKPPSAATVTIGSVGW